MALRRPPGTDWCDWRWWKKCKARTASVKRWENGRCDQFAGHTGPHAADNTGYDLHWFDGVYVGRANV